MSLLLNVDVLRSQNLVQKQNQINVVRECNSESEILIKSSLWLLDGDKRIRLENVGLFYLFKFIANRLIFGLWTSIKGDPHLTDFAMICKIRFFKKGNLLLA